MLDAAVERFDAFFRSLDDYGVVAKGAAGEPEPRDPTQRRAAKIAAFKAERELKSRIEVRWRIAAALTAQSLSSRSDDDGLRDLWLTRLRYAAMQARGSLSSIAQERDILAMAPPSPDGRSAAPTADTDLSWRLDSVDLNRTRLADRTGPMLDSSGRPLRPFTILPTRQDVRVFGPGHNLPTMSVDEFLEAEASRMISGGGQAGADRDQREREDRDALLEGDNAAGERARETQRIEDQRWDAYRDEHRRGEGNRLNHG